MQVRLYHDDPLSQDTPLLALPVFSGEEPLLPLVARVGDFLGGAFARALSAGDFRGKEEEVSLFYHPDSASGGPRRFLFVGVGARADLTTEGLRKFSASAVRRAEQLSVTELSLYLPPEFSGGLGAAVRAAAEGATLAAWDFRELKSPKKGTGADENHPLVQVVVLCVEGDRREADRGLQIGIASAEGENLARRLQSLPGNIATPTYLAESAQALASEYGFEITILGPEEMRAEGMGALLAVSAGSEEEPRLMVLEHRGGRDGDPPLALVGKGLTFDSGGISIKPALGMEEMKYDMSGGAAVLGAMKAIAMMKLEINVVAVIPSSENLVSGRATKPGDVIRTRAGKTVEVINTDAEGRLILADALSFVVDRYAPAAVVDCATLTGAVSVALGNQAAGLLGNDEGLIEEIRAAGDRSGERCWPLPLWKEYRKQLDSPVADLQNVGGRAAGTITAAYFLSEFVGETKWAHLDIAATAYGEPRAPYHRKGAFGFPTRLLVEWVLSRAR
jgi:leucyl aminopeptidase